jgi:hypothetical protein
MGADARSTKDVGRGPLVAMTTRDLDEIRAVTDQLEPVRAQSCRLVLTMAAVMLDEIKLRAHARPLDEPEP